MYEIARQMLEQESYKLDEDAIDLLRNAVVPCDGNAREVRNAVSKIILNHSSRVAKLDEPDLKR